MAEINYSRLKSFDGKVSESDFNALVDVLPSLTLCNGVGYTVSRNPTGTVLVTKPGKGGGGAALCPFDVIVTAGESDDERVANIRPGSVNSLLPDNIFDEINFSVSDVLKIKVRATSDGEKITGATLIADGAEAEVQTPTPFALPSVVEILVAVVVGGVAYKIIECGSINLTGVEQFRTDKSPPAEPGELPYTPYYKWNLV